MSKKIIILHDTFLYKWWGERLILMMAKLLHADLASWFFSAGSFDLEKEGFKWKKYALSNEVFAKGFRHLKLKFAFMFRTGMLKDYDTVIFSGDCVSGVRNTKKSQQRIYYCHTPPRYLYDLHDLYVQKVPRFMRWAFKIACKIFRSMYESDIKKMDLIFTNSKNTRDRLKKFLGIDSQVLYPPVQLGEFAYIKTLDYYLSFARLADAKRVDKIVEAFQKMPDKKLLVVYGENDPQREKIFTLAKGYENISFVTFSGNIGFKECVGNAIATIYIPVDEDFGMSPVESMSAWKPVIGVAEWWLKETILHEKTGILLEPDFDIGDIVDAVEFLTPEKCQEMRYDCEYRARDFSIEHFETQLKSYIFSSESEESLQKAENSL